MWQMVVANPGFSRGRAPTLQGAPTYDFSEFSLILHEIERIWTRGRGASKILLCRSATDWLCKTGTSGHTLILVKINKDKDGHQRPPHRLFQWRIQDFQQFDLLGASCSQGTPWTAKALVVCLAQHSTTPTRFSASSAIQCSIFTLTDPSGAPHRLTFFSCLEFLPSAM